jgi:hypothetical protein
MDSTRISLARVLELGVPMSWHEAAAIVHEALVLTGPTKGTRPNRVGPDECVITRGGEVTLVGPAAKARPETIVRLLEDLLPACDTPGGLGAAYERGSAIAFLEELSQRTTPKRRRVEIASVSIRAIAAEADRARAADDAIADDLPLADFIPAPPPQIAPPIRERVPEPPPVSRATPFEAAPANARVSLAIEDDRPAPETNNEFDRLRTEMAERAEVRPWLDAQALLDRLRAVDAKKLAAVAVPVVLIITWWALPSADPALPGTPKQYDPVALAAIPLVPGWADIDRLGGRATDRARAAAVPLRVDVPPSSAPVVAVARPTAAIVAEPRADAAVALVPPASEVPTAVALVPAPTAPAVAATVARPTAAPAASPAPNLAAGAEGEAETVYSWTNEAVEPPVIRSPAMPSWSIPGPTATIDGPYLEVLVDQRGQVETVRVRGRIEAGETYYRHRMILASAKLWQFAPARLSGRPVRYVARVLLDEPRSR